MTAHSWHTKKFRPLGARIVVKLDAKAEQYGRVHIPDDWRRQPQTATVVAVGPGAYDKYGVRHPITVGEEGEPLRPGDRVFLGKYNGLPMADPEDDYQGDREPRYYLLEQREQKHANAVEFDDCYGVLQDEESREHQEWSVPK